MATREELARLRAANDGLSKRVRAELADFFLSMDLSRPEAVRDALLEFMPLLVAEYGDLSEAVALEWYEEVRESAGKRAVRALSPPSGIPAEAVQAKVRYNAKHLWTPTPEQTLSGLLVAADKYIKQPGRSAIAYNATRNGSRWIRVPQGTKTCSFCLMLAGRSGAWLYRSKGSAQFDSKTGDKYHGDCDCQPAEVDNPDDLPNQDQNREYFDMYLISREKSGSGDINDILYDMRRRFPDQLKDGVVDDDYLSRVG